MSSISVNDSALFKCNVSINGVTNTDIIVDSITANTDCGSISSPISTYINNFSIKYSGAKLYKGDVVSIDISSVDSSATGFSCNSYIVDSVDNLSSYIVATVYEDIVQLNVTCDNYTQFNNYMAGGNDSYFSDVLYAFFMKYIGSCWSCVNRNSKYLVTPSLNDFSQYTLKDLMTIQRFIDLEDTLSSVPIEIDYDSCTYEDGNEESENSVTYDYVEYHVQLSEQVIDYVDDENGVSGHTEISYENHDYVLICGTTNGTDSYYKLYRDNVLEESTGDVVGSGLQIVIPLITVARCSDYSIYKPHSYFSDPSTPSYETYKNLSTLDWLKEKSFDTYGIIKKLHGINLCEGTYKIPATSDSSYIGTGTLLRVNKSDGTSKIVPVFKITYKYDGGLYMIVSSGKLEDCGENSSSSTYGTNIVASGASNINLSKFNDVCRSINSINSKLATLGQNMVTVANIGRVLSEVDYLTLQSAFVQKMQSETITTNYLSAKGAEIGWLKADSAIITDLESDTANITNLMFGTAGGTSITTDFANSVVSVIGDAQIESAMIKGLAVEKLLSGTIYTNNINIQSEDGGMKIVGNTQQFKDASGKIRMQMGQDGNGDFSMSIFGTDGKTAVLTDEGLATADAIPDGLIKNVKIADDANISAGKLDIASLFTTMNADKTHTLHSSIIMFDETNQSLNVALSQMSSNIETLTNVAYGQVVTYNTDTIPTLNNYPAYDWVIPVYPSDTLYPSDDLIFKYGYEEYVKHVGSVCYMKDSTDSYRFCMADDGTFYWKLIEDSETAVLNTKVAALEVSTSGISSQVASMSQTISAQGNTLTTLASEISQNESDIALRVLETTYNNGMSGKSNKATILSEINLSTEGIKIKADRLNLDGLVTITNLSNGSTTIDGACIKTGKIAAERLELSGYATIGNLKDGKTTISGNNITTGTISADRIDANGLFAKDITASGTISGVKLKSPQIIGESRDWESDGTITHTMIKANTGLDIYNVIDSSGATSKIATFDAYEGTTISTNTFVRYLYHTDGNPYIYSDGYISSFSFGSNSSGTYLHTNTFYGAYGITWWASDTRLKENIEKTEQTALDKINKIDFIQFDWKLNDKHEILGVSANQLEEIMPDTVFRVKQPEDSEYDFLRNIDTGKMTTYALKAIQELSQVIKQQNERIEELESMIQKGTVD